LVHEYGGSQIGFFLILSDIESIGFPVELPIDGADLIAAYVLAMLFKLDTDTFIGRAMHANIDTFYDRARIPLECGNAIAIISGQ
jgi:hypothetical protein